MTSPPNTGNPKRKWYQLALRHLRIALRLSRQGFHDGSFFHSYHAFECALSALIAAKGYEVPPEGKVNVRVGGRIVRRYYPSPRGQLPGEQSTHKVRLTLFTELADQSKPYFATFSPLSRFLTVSARNNALYYDPILDRLPYEHYDNSFAQGVYNDVHKFVREVREDIL